MLAIPYLAPTVYRNVLAPYNNITAGSSPKINITMITPPVSSQGTEPHITLTVWRGAGSDYQLSGLVRSNLDSIDTGRSLEAQSSILEKFSTPCQSLTCDKKGSMEQGFVTSETSGPIVDVMRRYYLNYATVLDNNHLLNDDWNDSSDIWRGPFEIYASMFKYTRGSHRYKILLTGTPTAEWYLISYSENGTYEVNNGLTGTSVNHCPIISVEVPFIAKHAYLPVYHDGYATCDQYEGGTVSVPAANVQTTLFSAGEDFIMGYLIPPPALVTTRKKPKRSTATLDGRHVSVGNTITDTPTLQAEIPLQRKKKENSLVQEE